MDFLIIVMNACINININRLLDEIQERVKPLYFYTPNIRDYEKGDLICVKDNGFILRSVARVLTIYFRYFKIL